MNYNVTINSVWDWEEGEESAADYSQGIPKSQIKKAMAEEYKRKVESSEWYDAMVKAGNLPYVSEQEAESEEEAKELAVQEFYEAFCGGDYYEPVSCDCDVEEIDSEEE